MLGRRQLRRLQEPLWALEPTAMALAQHMQIREIRLFEIFSKERREERKRKLKDDMQRGYFDDFKDFRDNKGKIFYAPEKLAPASQAPIFPSITALASDGSPSHFPPPSGASAPAASLVCVAFRAGAQGMVESWAVPFSQKYGTNTSTALYELSLVESIVMRMWPFRSMLMSSGGKSQARYDKLCTYLYYFKDYEPLRLGLHMTNILTGYVYLVDSEGRLRWRGSGYAEARELESMIKCTDQLLEESDTAEHSS